VPHVIGPHFYRSAQCTQYDLLTKSAGQVFELTGTRRINSPHSQSPQNISVTLRCFGASDTSIFGRPLLFFHIHNRVSTWQRIRAISKFHEYPPRPLTSSHRCYVFDVRHASCTASPLVSRRLRSSSEKQIRFNRREIYGLAFSSPTGTYLSRVLCRPRTAENVWCLPRLKTTNGTIFLSSSIWLTAVTENYQRNSLSVSQSVRWIFLAYRFPVRSLWRQHHRLQVTTRSEEDCDRQHDYRLCFNKLYVGKRWSKVSITHHLLFYLSTCIYFLL